MSERPPTILEVSVQRVGMRRGANVVVFIGQWALTMNKHADLWHVMSDTQRVEAFAKVASCNRSSAYRKLAVYREVFTIDPTELVQKAGLEVTTAKQAKDTFKVGMRVISP